MENHEKVEGLVASLSEREAPRKRTWYSVGAQWGVELSAFGAAFIAIGEAMPWLKKNLDNHETVYKKFPEGTSSWKMVLEDFKVDVKTLPKYWKSATVATVGMFAMIGAGEWLANRTRQKIEEATFREENPDWEAKQQRVDKFLAQIKEAEKSGVPVSEVAHAGKMHDAPEKVQQV